MSERELFCGGGLFDSRVSAMYNSFVQIAWRQHGAYDRSKRQFGHPPQDLGCIAGPGATYPTIAPAARCPEDLPDKAVRQACRSTREC